MTSRMARWRAVVRIARRDALRSRGRTALVVLLMMLPVAAGTFIVGAIRTSTPTVETRLAWQVGTAAQARLSVGCGERMPLEQGPYEVALCDGTDGELGPVDVAELARLLPSGDDVAPAARISVPLRSARALVDSAEVLAVEASSVPGLLGRVDGDAVPGPGEIVLRSQVAERLGVGVGSVVELGDLEARVVGIGHSTSSTAGLVAPSTMVAGDLEQLWFVVGDEPVSWSDVRSLNTIGIAVASRAVFENLPSPEQQRGQFTGSGADTARVAGVVLAVAALGLLEIVLLVGPAFAVGAKRNARVLALVAATGGGPADVRRIVLASGLVAGVVAGVAGVVIGTAAMLGLYALQRGSIHPPPNLVIPILEPLGIAAIALLLGLAAAWFPSRAAGSADVVTTLAGRRGDVPARRRVAWSGLGLGALGVVMAIVATAVGEPVLLAAGVVVVEVGLVMAAGMIVELVGRLAPHLGLPVRFALRDARRHRSRTAPAVAAVLAAVAAATVGLVWTASDARAQEAMWRPVAADGVGLVSLSTWDLDAGGLQEQFDRAEQVVAHGLPDARVTPVRLLGRDEAAIGPGASWAVATLPDPATECPDGEQESVEATDERCRIVPSAEAGYTWGFGALVDDGSLVGRLGLDGARAAAEALARGEVLVNDPEMIWPDGRARLTVMDDDWAPATGERAVTAHLVPWTSSVYDLTVPPDLAEELVSDAEAAAEDGQPIAVRVVAAALTGTDLDQAAVDRVNRDLATIDPNLRVSVEREQAQARSDADLAAIIIGAALVVALLATGLSVGLAVTDSRPDLATLWAVGAGPRVRRRISSAQAGVIASIGTLTGVSTGLLLAYVLGRWQQTDQFTGYLWETIVPWPYVAALAVGLPLLAVVGGRLLGGSRLPVRRRMAE